MKRIIFIAVGIFVNLIFTDASFALRNHSYSGQILNYRHGYNFQADLMFPISGNLESPFGWTTSFNQGHFNEGIYLIPKLVDSPVFSPASGKIVYLNFVKDKGKTMGIKSSGFFSVVAITNESQGDFNKKVGDFVKKGEKIGAIEKGRILFEVRDFKGNPYDPIRIITHKKIDTSSKNQIYIAFRDMLLQQGFKIPEIKNMFLIASMESSLNPSAINYNRNGTVDIGLFQINSVWHKRCGVNSTELYDVNANIKCALIVLRNQGLSAWVTWKNYLRG